MGRRARRQGALVTILCALVTLFPRAGAARLQWLGRISDAENEAIRYSATTPSDAIARLQQDIDAGTTRLQFDTSHGYLNSVLRALRISPASQSLVFSRTSFQRDLISPERPRALYFNHDVYVGWVQDAPVLEIASVDPRIGAIFYTLDQARSAHPVFRREVARCLSCHDSPAVTGGVPGLIMKSVYPDESGQPIVAAGTFLTTDRSPLPERWGGWYVTGTHGSQRHMGNMTVGAAAERPLPDLSPGANVTDLRTRFDTRRYATAHSDLVALMILEHQTAVQNLITRAGYRTRMALAFDEIRRATLGRPDGDSSEDTRRVVESVAEPLVHAMLFVGEAPLSERVAGTSAFADQFNAQGPRTTGGRSLFELDLQRRLFRHRCSYMIYSASFDGLPSAVRQQVYRRLWDVLGGADSGSTFAHLAPAERATIRTILLETKPDFAAWIRARASP